MTAISNQANQQVLLQQNQNERPGINLNATMRRLNQIALPVVLLASISMLPGADGGPAAYGVCILACEAVAFGAAALTGGVMAPVAAASLVTCTNFCWAALYAPTL